MAEDQYGRPARLKKLVARLDENFADFANFRVF
jgi:hypothetical protein